MSKDFGKTWYRFATGRARVQDTARAGTRLQSVRYPKINRRGPRVRARTMVTVDPREDANGCSACTAHSKAEKGPGHATPQVRRRPIAASSRLDGSHKHSFTRSGPRPPSYLRHHSPKVGVYGNSQQHSKRDRFLRSVVCCASFIGRHQGASRDAAVPASYRNRRVAPRLPGYRRRRPCEPGVSEGER